MKRFAICTIYRQWISNRSVTDCALLSRTLELVAVVFFCTYLAKFFELLKLKKTILLELPC